MTVDRASSWMQWSSVTLAVLLIACAPTGRRTTAPTGGAAVTAQQPDASPAACPAIDDAALEPPTAHPDTRTIALTRVFVREEARDTIVTVPAPFDLDVIRAPREVPPPKGGGGFGLGWHALSADWVASTISPEVTAPLAAWDAAWEELAKHQRRSALLDDRARYARSVEPPAAWGGRRCVEDAAVQAQRDEEQAGAVVERAEAELLAVLEGLPSRKPGDAMLLGSLLAQQLPFPREPGSDAAKRPIALLTEVAGDASLDRELRARAAEQLAQLHEPRSKPFTAALEQVLSLTKDPDLTVDTLVKLADLEANPTKAEARRVRIVETLDQRAEDDWRLGRTLADLAAARLDRGAFELARDDAARCARASATGSPRDPDPWGCAPVLAEALAELADAPAGVEVPLPFLGPLALASIDAALARRDWNQAKHVGTLLLAELPQAAEAPEALAVLMGLPQRDDERAALTARKTREYGPEGPWATAQLERLAWDHEPEDARRRLAALLEPTRPPVTVRLPEKPVELTEELRARARLVAEACRDVLPTKGRPPSVAVNTVGATPVATVRGAKPAAAACLRRATESRFRSVGPVQISFGVARE